MGRPRSSERVTTDGHRAYAEAVEGAFGMDVDYAMLIKLYGNDSFDTKYSPGECMTYPSHPLLEVFQLFRQISTRFTAHPRIMVRLHPGGVERSAFDPFPGCLSLAP
jgi:hypothetical protein